MYSLLTACKCLCKYLCEEDDDEEVLGGNIFIVKMQEAKQFVHNTNKISILSPCFTSFCNQHISEF